MSASRRETLLGNHIGILADQPDFYMGILHVELVDDIRQKQMGCRRQMAYAKNRRLLTSQRKFLFCLFDGFQDRFRIFQKQCSAFGERYFLGVAHKKLRVQFPFQHFDLMADGGLGEIKLLGCP